MLSSQTLINIKARYDFKIEGNLITITSKETQKSKSQRAYFFRQKIKGVDPEQLILTGKEILINLFGYAEQSEDFLKTYYNMDKRTYAYFETHKRTIRFCGYYVSDDFVKLEQKEKLNEIHQLSMNRAEQGFYEKKFYIQYERRTLFNTCVEHFIFAEKVSIAELVQAQALQETINDFILGNIAYEVKQDEQYLHWLDLEGSYGEKLLSMKNIIYLIE